MKTIQIQYYHSPAGELMLGSFEDKLCLCDWMLEKRRDRIDYRIQKMLGARYTIESSAMIEKAFAELDDYFARRRTMFDIPLLFVGTDFQKRVWSKLLELPYGQTISYGEMARQLGCPKAVRAVANANGANALSIFAPCHRVIGSNSRLVGYAGGLEAKRILLELEG